MHKHNPHHALHPFSSICLNLYLSSNKSPILHALHIIQDGQTEAVAVARPPFERQDGLIVVLAAAWHDCDLGGREIRRGNAETGCMS